MFLRPFGLYCSACFGSLFVSILCTCRSHFFWYCFISFTMFCTPVLHWFFSLSSFVIPSKCLKNVICAASKRCSSLFFSTQASLPNFNAALAVMLWILNFVALFICFPKWLRIAPFILLYVCNLSSKSLPYSAFVHLWQYLAHGFFIMRNISDKAVAKIKTHVLNSVTFFFRKLCRLWGNVEKCRIARPATDENIIQRMRFACWIGYRNTLSICNKYCFFMATAVVRILRDVTIIGKLPVLFT